MIKYKKKQLWIQRDSLNIYGELLIPSTNKKKHPLAIIGHGFTGTYKDNYDCAAHLAKNGVAAFVFDFCGGSNYSKSDGNTIDMSVLTEVQDMKVVLNHFISQDYIDQNKIFLMGESQGGFVAALTAAEMKESIKGLALWYPAFTIPNFGEREYKKIENIPDVINMWGVMIGKKYYADLWDMDVYNIISKYTGPVILFHGTADGLVPISSSEKASTCYANAKLITYPSEGHGFYGSSLRDMNERVVSFVMEQIQKL